VEAATANSEIILGEQPSAFPAEDAALHHHTPAHHLVKDVGRFL